MTALLDFDSVRRLLPQSYPFVFIDKVLDLVPNESIECLKNVSGNEPFFAGHFPEVAIMPGALMMEACAQASILLFVMSNSGESMLAEPDHVFVVGRSRSHFMHPVVPGDSLHLFVDVERIYSRAAMVKARGEVEGREVLRASLTFARVDRAAIQRGAAGAATAAGNGP